MPAADLVSELLEEFAARRARGERPDPVDYLARAGDRADELRDVLDAFLVASAPPPPTDAVLTMMSALLRDEPPLLALRQQHALTLDGMADRLVDDLRLDPRTRPRVRALYQRLEGGRIDLRRVRQRLRTSLAAILGVDERDIIAARTAPQDHVFARGPQGWQDALAALPEDSLPGPPSAEVDELFGGPL